MEQKADIAYKKALKELELLVEKIESPDADLENITGEVKKALELIKVCREHIRGFREESEKLLK